MGDHIVSDGETEVTADELVPGQLYVLEGRNGNGHLRHIPRQEDDLPRLRITPEALEAIRKLSQGMRKAMDGYKPDITLVASALLLNAASLPEAPSIVRDFAIAKFQAAQTDGAADSDDH